MEGTQAPEQIIINGREYSPEDATQLVELGNKYREIEGKLNTPIDKVYPEFTRLSQEKKAWEEERKELEQLRQLKAEQTNKKDVPEDAETINANARKYGITTDKYLQEKGYMTRDEAEKFWEQKQNLQQETQRVLNQYADLEKKVDGSDGRVPFDQKAVLAYAAAYKIDDPMQAYDQMNERANAKWKQAQIDREQRPGLTTLKTNGSKKEPARPKVTNDNLGQMLSEFLDGIPE